MTTSAYTSSYRDVGSAYRRTTDRTRELQEIRRLAHLLDEVFRIPVINYRVGLDSVLGLVPIVGDFTGFALSGYIIWKAADMGVPRKTIMWMIFNSLLDLIIGSIPVLGNLFDLFWKANKRNVRLIEAYLLS